VGGDAPREIFVDCDDVFPAGSNRRKIRPSFTRMRDPLLVSCVVGVTAAGGPASAMGCSGSWLDAVP
jgi:hypothetical protein